MTDVGEWKDSSGVVPPVNPCIHEKFSRVTHGVGYANYRRTDGSLDYSHVGPITQARTNNFDVWTGFSQSIDEDSLVATAKSRAIANIDKTPYSFAEDLVELKSTMKYVSSNLLKLRRPITSFQALVKRLRKRGLNGDEALASAWLEYRFVFTPIVRSVFDAVDAYKTYGDNFYPPLRRAIGVASDGFSESHQPVETFAGTGSRTYAATRTKETKVFATIRYRTTAPTSGIKFHLGIRNKDIPVTVWNVARLSFIVDRFFDISTFLKATTNLNDPRVEILSGCVSRKISTLETMQLVGQTGQTGWSTSATGEVLEDQYSVYNRAPWTPKWFDVFPRGTLGPLGDLQSNIDLIALFTSTAKR
jgi:hypothetical protein